MLKVWKSCKGLPVSGSAVPQVASDQLCFSSTKVRQSELAPKSHTSKVQHPHPEIPDIYQIFLHPWSSSNKGLKDKLSEFWKYDPKCTWQVYKFISEMLSPCSPSGLLLSSAHWWHHKPLSAAASPKGALFHIPWEQKYFSPFLIHQCSPCWFGLAESMSPERFIAWILHLLHGLSISLFNFLA